MKLNQQIVGSSGTEILNLFDEKRTVSRSKRSKFIFLVNSGAHQGENTYNLHACNVQVMFLVLLWQQYVLPFGKKSEKPRNLAWWTSRQLCTDLLRRNSQPQGNSGQCYFAKLIRFSLPSPEFLNTAVASFCIFIMIWLKGLDNVNIMAHSFDSWKALCGCPQVPKSFGSRRASFVPSRPSSIGQYNLGHCEVTGEAWDELSVSLSKVTVDLVVVFLLAPHEN